MALSGIRDLSIIASAPQERLPVRSFVTPFNDFNVKISCFDGKIVGFIIFFPCVKKEN